MRASNKALLRPVATRGTMAVALVGLLASNWAGAAAQTAEEVASLDEIIVTARKRSETLQQVPVSASVLGGDAIADMGIANLQDLTASVPAVRLAKGSTSNRQFIRGIGSGDNPSFEQSVGTFIDDIYHGRARFSEAALFDVERVEVLKGPQTVYFGNNAIAGALNIVTRDPGDSLSGDIRLAYTPAFDARVAEVGLDLPVADTLSVRIAGQLSDNDGWIKDSGAGEKAPHTRDRAVRSTALWKPTERLTARIKAQYVDQDGRGGLPIVRSGCPQPASYGPSAGFCAAALAAGAGPFDRTDARNTSPGQFTTQESQDYVATLDWEGDGYILTSVTGHTRYTYGLGTDLDMTPLPLLSIAAPERFSQTSQELRLSSTDDSPVDYIAGLYYHHSKLQVGNRFNYGFLGASINAAAPFRPLAPYLPFGINNFFHETAGTLSGFGALTWKVRDDLRATGALRYSRVEKDFDRTITVGTASANYGPLTPFPASVAALGAAFAAGGRLATVGTTSLSRSDKQLTPSVSVQYDWTPQVMLYARYDRGFKAGGFNGVDLVSAAGTLPFAPEKVDAFEAGVKAKLFDDRMSVSLDAFRSKYRDLQLAGIVPSSNGAYVNRVQNAGGAVTQGIELEMNARLSGAWRTGLSATLLDSHYTSYPNATPTAQQTAAGLPVQDLSGKRTPFAPSLSGSWNLSYETGLTADLSLTITNQLFVSSGVYLGFSNDPDNRQASYLRDDLTLALSSDTGWEVALVGRNLTDETIRSFGATLPTSLGSYVFMTEPPRSVTVQLKYAF